MMSRETVREMDSRQLVGCLLRDLSGLADSEIRLAKAELRETAQGTVLGAIKLAIAAGLGAGALTSLLLAGILALAMAMPGWVAGLIAFVIFGLAATILLFTGKDDLRSMKARLFRMTRESLREDVEWAKHRMTSNGK